MDERAAGTRPRVLFTIEHTIQDASLTRSGERVQLVAPGWDFDFPGRESAPNYLKAEFSRPFLPRHFPGYEMYFWLDADAWVQEWRAVDIYCAAAAKGAPA